MDDQRANRKGGGRMKDCVSEVPARVMYVSGPRTIQILLAPGHGMVDGGVPIEIDLDLVPFELRTPNTDLIVTRRNGEIVAVCRMAEKN
jgi:hypothetical protein